MTIGEEDRSFASVTQLRADKGMNERKRFVQSMVDQGVLRFGDFTLKSGKKSPYFFNLGNVAAGPGLAELGRSYARCILKHDLQPEILFGPAYKGIPFVVTTAIALAEHGVDVGISYNRKEAKAHGEGGWLVGSDMVDKRVVVIDDVVVDGSTKVESAELIRNEGGILSGIVLGIDRAELVDGRQTAGEALAAQLHTDVYSVVSLQDVLGLLRDQPGSAEQYLAMLNYAQTNCKLPI